MFRIIYHNYYIRLCNDYVPVVRLRRRVPAEGCQGAGRVGAAGGWGAWAGFGWWGGDVRIVV